MLENSGNAYDLYKRVMEQGYFCPVLYKTYALYATRGSVQSLSPALDWVIRPATPGGGGIIKDAGSLHPFFRTPPCRGGLYIRPAAFWPLTRTGRSEINPYKTHRTRRGGLYIRPRPLAAYAARVDQEIDPYKAHRTRRPVGAAISRPAAPGYSVWW